MEGRYDSSEGMQSLLDYLHQAQEANKPESEEERKRRERSERTQGLVNGIGDLGRAIANLYYTTQYAPNGYDEGKSLSKAHQERLERARKEREAQSDRYLNYLKQEKAVLDGERSWKALIEKQQLEQKKWEDKEANNKALTDAQVKSHAAMTKYREAIANKNDAMAEKYRQEVLLLQAKEHYPELDYNQKQAESKARIDALNALAEQRRSSANGSTTTTAIERDRYGNETGRTVTKTPNGGQQGGKPQGGGQKDGGSLLPKGNQNKGGSLLPK
ncbi:MAG: hypothetical protein IJ789_01820 [Bacteroidales bacterium]|nr:hypothetical protein [Bacteroidales bacterium]